MRVLVDEEHMDWDKAWNIVRNTCAYTNHTILAEALEKWPLDLFRNLLPRIYTICEEINRRLMNEIVSKYGQDSPYLNELAIIKDNTIHMASLCIHGSFSVNGVAALHTDILKNIEMKPFSDYYPGKFNNKTNGITHRRWLIQSNSELVDIIKEYCGEDFSHDMTKLEKLLPYADDEQVQLKFFNMKRARKQALAQKIYRSQGVSIDVNSILIFK